jgi:histone-lysine N-methyltransferase SETMAR
MENFENWRKKQHLREVLLHHFFSKKTFAESHRLLVETYGEYALSRTQCYEWFQHFKSGDFEVSDKERPGGPKKFEDAELQALLDENSCRTQKELALELNVDIATISRRLHAMGKIRKLGKWVPHQLNENQLKARIETCKKHLAEHKKHSFLSRIVTGDEKWVYYDNPKRKADYVDPGQPSTSQSKRDIHCQKVMLCIWWDQKGVVYYELLKPGETVTADRYRMQLIKMEHALKNKRPRIASKRDKVLFHDDNARPHRAQIVKKKVEDFGWDRLDQPAYSPDLAPSDYHLFRSIQIALADVRFHNPEEVRKWVDDWIAGKDEEFFRRGIHKLPERWREVIANDGEYIG